MIKKIAIILFISFALISCGKKSCPNIGEEDKCSQLFKRSS